eukprot:scaffold2266_cov112-Isochrysis_galbana.AAC.1
MARRRRAAREAERRRLPCMCSLAAERHVRIARAMPSRAAPPHRAAAAAASADRSFCHAMHSQHASARRMERDACAHRASAASRRRARRTGSRTRQQRHAAPTRTRARLSAALSARAHVLRVPFATRAACRHTLNAMRWDTGCRLLL